MTFEKRTTVIETVRHRRSRRPRPRRRLTLEVLEPRHVLSAGSLLITEFMASNARTLADGDGKFSDWIEIHNAGQTIVDLSNHFLTDRASNLERWAFPSIMIQPGEYLVVFASTPLDSTGNVLEDYVDAGGNLHTNFSLSAEGEYLALTYRDPVTQAVTILHEYAPQFPPQRGGISYGIEQGTMEFVAAGSPAKSLVPADGSLGLSWTAIGFNDSAWSSATLGVGYEVEPQGGTGQGLTNLALGGVATQSSVAFGGVPERAIDGNYASNNWTHTAPRSSEDEPPSWWQVDLGDTFVLERVVLFNRTSCCGSRLRDITVEVLDANDEVVFTTAPELLNAGNAGYTFPNGPVTIEVDLVARNGGLPVLGRKVRVTRTPDPDLIGTGGMGNVDEADVLSLREVEVWGREVPSYHHFFQTDLQEVMFQQNATVYLRSAFQVDDPTALNQLLLRVQYDDGFVAYLNGTQIASRNAPLAPAFNSTATAERSHLEALVVETIDVSAHIDLLIPGTNVLAIHGLNLSAADNDFLIVPELIGVSTSALLRYFDVPTPGAPNGSGYIGFVAEPEFSVERGFYDAPFQVEITTETPGAQIYYTINGEVPTEANGLLYTGPIDVSGTGTLRATAVLDGYLASKTATHTYLFLNDIVRQDYQATLDAGFPASWGSTSPDYGMDPKVIGTFDEFGNPLGGDLFGGVYANAIKDSLLSIPTMSIVMDVDDLFGSSGIYTHSTSRGIAWERPTSVELIYPDGAEGFQVDAGIRIQGGAFRSHSLTKKHAFRLAFRSVYGPSKLEFPLFGEGAVSEFNTITLRAGSNDAYSWSSARFTEQYIRDEFGRSLQRDAGHPSAHGTFVHLYVNGIYWGLYNPVERPDNEFAASYAGGDPDNWDSIHDDRNPNGDKIAWNAMMAKTAEAGSSLAAYMELQGKNLDGTPHATVVPLLNLENYIDYIAINAWGGNWDWPRKNFWAGRDRNPETTTGFMFFNWDFENTMGNNRSRSPLNQDVFDPSKIPGNSFTGPNNAGQPHVNLLPNAEYRMLFADRVHRLFFNDGILTPDNLIERYLAIADQVEAAIVAESARWGDQHHGTPLTLADWMNERNWIVGLPNTRPDPLPYLPNRSNIVLQQLKNYGLYPNVVAPTFSQFGGIVPSDFNLTITAPAGSIYYTLDGSDPRLVGGGINPAATLYSGPITLPEGAAEVRARILSGSAWSAVVEASFHTAPPPVRLAGDYDQTSIVDLADYEVWKSTFGSLVEPHRGADGSGNGIIDAADYTVWRNNLGRTADAFLFNSLGHTYTQDFNSFRGTAETLPPFFSVTSDTVAEIYHGVFDSRTDPASSFTGIMAATSDGVDYSLAWRESTGAAALDDTRILFTFTNNTGQPISGLSVSYGVEAWVNGRRDNQVRFKYDIYPDSAASQAAEGRQAFETDIFATANPSHMPIATNGEQFVLDGKDAANRVTVSGFVDLATLLVDEVNPGLGVFGELLPGQTAYFRWQISNAVILEGNRSALGIDNISITPLAAPMGQAAAVGESLLVEPAAAQGLLVVEPAQGGASALPVGARLNEGHGAALDVALAEWARPRSAVEPVAARGSWPARAAALRSSDHLLLVAASQERQIDVLGHLDHRADDGKQTRDELNDFFAEWADWRRDLPLRPSSV